MGNEHSLTTAFYCFFYFYIVHSSQLGGDKAPVDWQGSFNCTYNFGGPGFKNTSAFSGR